MRNGIEPQGYDFHCHMDLYPDPVAMISACDNKQIMTLAVTTTPRAWPQNRDWARASSYVYPAVGLHPEVVSERYHELELLVGYMKETTLIGEVGLDGNPRYKKSWLQQQEVFARVLQTAQALGGRVISVHSRYAAKDVVQMIEDYTTPDRVLCVLHWFSGVQSIASKALSMGCYFSVNSQMLKSVQGLGLLESLPTDRLLTETDGPFTKELGRKSVPTDVLLLVERLAKARHVDQAMLTRELEGNAERVFGFAGIYL